MSGDPPPDTNEYFDGGNLRGELTNKQYAQREWDAAIARITANLEDIEACLTQALMGVKAVRTDLEIEA